MKNLVKTMLMSILTAGTMMSFTACSSEDDVLMETKGNVSLDINQYAAAERTVLVYLAGKNNLSKSLQTNLEQMKAGSKRIGNNTLLAFVRRDIQGEQPWLARISNGELKDSLSLDDMGMPTATIPPMNTAWCWVDILLAGSSNRSLATHVPSEWTMATAMPIVITAKDGSTCRRWPVCWSACPT